MNAEQWIAAKAKDLARQQVLNAVARLDDTTKPNEDWLTTKAKGFAKQQALNVAAKLSETTQSGAPSSGTGLMGSIDGKTVPEMLAVSVVQISPRSPNMDSILRGLPDFGKALLKLDGAHYAYKEEVPEEPTKLEAAPALPPPAVKQKEGMSKIIFTITGILLAILIVHLLSH